MVDIQAILSKKRTRKIMIDDVPVIDPEYKASTKLKDKTAIITGGDSGIGRSVALLFAMEGCDMAIVYHESDNDAMDTKRMVEEVGRKCILIKGEIADPLFCKAVIDQVKRAFGKLSILVNNAAIQYQQKQLENITPEQLRYTFEVNIFSMYFLSAAALDIMEDNACVINTTSITAFRGSPDLLDYSATKGAILAFTRALSQNLLKRHIRVNAIAPGPIWTPLIFESFRQEKIDHFGDNTPMGRAGFPFEVAPAFCFLASQDASYITGQVIHINGGEIVA